MSQPVLSELLQESCVSLNKGEPAIDSSTAQQLADAISDWKISDDYLSISKDFKFKNYYETIAFVNSVAWIAHHQDHHPDLNVSYNQCRITYSTHSVGGLSRNDFICAARINQLYT